MGQIKSKSSKQLKLDLLDAIQALGGKNRIIEEAKRSPEAFWTLVKECVKFIPKEIDLKHDHKMIIELAIPKSRAIDHISSKAIDKSEVIELECTDSNTYDDTDTSSIEDSDSSTT